MKSAFTILNILVVTLGVRAPSVLAVNRVLSLDGDGDYVEVADSDVLNNIGRQVTIEAWIKVDRFTNTGMPIIYKGDRRSQAPVGTEFGNRSYTLWLWEASRLQLNVAPSGKSRMFINSLSGAIQPMIWYHVAGVVDASNGVMKVISYAVCCAGLL
jgi:hypothetical protein